MSRPARFLALVVVCDDAGEYQIQLQDGTPGEPSPEVTCYRGGPATRAAESLQTAIEDLTAKMGEHAGALEDRSMEELRAESRRLDVEIGACFDRIESYLPGRTPIPYEDPCSLCKGSGGVMNTGGIDDRWVRCPRCRPRGAEFPAKARRQ